MSKNHIIALCITLITECSGMILFSLIMKKYRKHILKNFLSVLFINLCTHTIFWYTYLLIKIDSSFKIYIFEVIIFIIEGILYRLICKICLWKAILLSFILNLVSFYFGNTIWNLIYH